MFKFSPDIPVAKLSVSGEGANLTGEGGRAGATTAVRAGETLSMDCHVQANPGVYNVTWYHNVSA